MKSVFVYYSDGHGDENKGLEEFCNREAASEFIAKRIVEDHNRNLKQYTVIEGLRLTPTAVEVVKVIRFD